jgi:hypothetical protein
MSEIKLRPGEEFVYNGIRFICLEIINGNYLAITADCWCEKRFNNEYKDGCNNWEKSTLRRFLNEDVLKEYFDAKQLIKQTSDLIADNGDKAYGTCEDYITLLTCDQCRKYRKFMPKYDDWVWTLTPRSCGVGNASYVRNINPSGELYDSLSIASSASGVAPVCLFNSNGLILH